MKVTVRTQDQLEAKNRGELISILKEEFKVTDPISRVSKGDLVDMVLSAQEPFTRDQKKSEKKVNKSHLLRMEITRRCRAHESLNSGDLMKFMEETHGIKMIRQFVVNVRVRHLAANPELLKI